MAEDMKQCYDACDRHGPVCDPCDTCDPCNPCDTYDPCEPVCEDTGWDWASWLPILLIVFLLCGGLDWFGGGKDDCCDGVGGGGLFGGSGALIIILIVIFFLCQNDKDGKGGFLGGLF